MSEVAYMAHRQKMLHTPDLIITMLTHTHWKSPTDACQSPALQRCGNHTSYYPHRKSIWSAWPPVTAEHMRQRYLDKLLWSSTASLMSEKPIRHCTLQGSNECSVGIKADWNYMSAWG